MPFLLGVLGAVGAAASAIGTGVATAAGAVGSAIGGAASTVASTVGGAASSLGGSIASVAGGVVEGVGGAVSGAAEGIAGIFGGGAEGVAGTAGQAGSLIEGVAGGVVEGGGGVAGGTGSSFAQAPQGLMQSMSAGGNPGASAGIHGLSGQTPVNAMGGGTQMPGANPSMPGAVDPMFPNQPMGGQAGSGGPSINAPSSPMQSTPPQFVGDAVSAAPQSTSGSGGAQQPSMMDSMKSSLKDTFSKENLTSRENLTRASQLMGGGDDSDGTGQAAGISPPSISPPQLGGPRENPYARFSSQDDLMAMYLQGSL
jgi:hypothetical protein